MSSDIDFLCQMFEELEKGEEGDGDGDADDVSSSISALPGEIILQILNKLLDLKMLCCCYLVSKRFSAIVVQVDAVSFTAPLLIPKQIASKPIISLQLYLKSVPFRSACSFLFKFRGLKSLCIQLPFSSHDRDIDRRCLFKWKVQFGRRGMESAIFLCPNSVVDSLNGTDDDEEEEEEDNGNMFQQKNDIFIQCLEECMEDWEAWNMMLLDFIKNLTTLEKVSITDSWRRGRFSLSGEKLREVKESVVHNKPASETEAEASLNMSNFYIPVLKLPVSGYVMKGVYVLEMKHHQGGIDALMNSDDGFEGREEAAYNEAVKVILGCTRVPFNSA